MSKKQLDKFARLNIARAKLLLSRTLLNAALAEIMGQSPDYSAEYLGVQSSYDRWIDHANMRLRKLEQDITDSDHE